MFKKLTFLLAGAGLVILAACNTDKCKDKNCGTNGTCNIVTGACDCTVGYEGATCATEQRTKTVGSYQCYERANTSGSVEGTPYAVNVAAAPSGSPVTSILLSNLGNYSLSGLSSYNVTATMVTTDSFTITNSSIGNTTFNGGGRISGTTITGRYVATYGTTTDNYLIRMTR